MVKLPDNVVSFLEKQSLVIASTLDKNGNIHCAVKGIVGIEDKGEIYIIDLYHGKTFANLTNNPNLRSTAVDEAKFQGYALKGKAEIVKSNKIKGNIMIKNNLKLAIIELPIINCASGVYIVNG